VSARSRSSTRVSAASRCSRSCSSSCRTRTSSTRDTARFPYGEHSAADLERFALEIAEHLLARRAKLLVVACNALSSAALPSLRARMLSTTLGVDVLGVIEPESRIAAAHSASRRIGLLATTATVASGAYDRALQAAAPDATLTSVAALVSRR